MQAESEAYNSESEIDFDLRQIIIKTSAEILEQRISATIEQKIGIKPKNIYIYSNINNKNTEADVQIEIEKVIVDMPDETDVTNITDEDSNWVQAYLKEILDCEIIIE